MKNTILPAMFFIITGLLTPMSQANSQPNSVDYSPYIQLAQSNSQSLDSAVKSVKQKTGGRILSAKTITENGQQIHKIKVLLPSGKVRVFKVNAQ